MPSIMDIPIYLDKGFILDLYSILIDGYLESKSIRVINDKSDSIRLQKSCRKQKSKDKKKSNNDKVKNKIRDRALSNYDEFLGSLDDRNSNRNECSIKRVYTTFYLLFSLKDRMYKKNMIRNITEEDILKNNIKCGEYVEFNGNISIDTTLNKVNNLIDIIECYDSNELNKLLVDKQIGSSITNYTVILNILKTLSAHLTKNNTVNMVMDLNQCKAVLNVNLNYFSDKNAYIYDEAFSACKVLCKVTNVVDSTKNIDLLAKTGMSQYYTEFLNSLNPYLNLLNDNNIITPKDLLISIEQPAIQVIPMAIYV